MQTSGNGTEKNIKRTCFENWERETPNSVRFILKENRAVPLGSLELEMRTDGRVEIQGHSRCWRWHLQKKKKLLISNKDMGSEKHLIYSWFIHAMFLRLSLTHSSTSPVLCLQHSKSNTQPVSKVWLWTSRSEWQLAYLLLDSYKFSPIKVFA